MCLLTFSHLLLNMQYLYCIYDFFLLTLMTTICYSFMCYNVHMFFLLLFCVCAFYIDLLSLAHYMSMTLVFLVNTTGSVIVAARVRPLLALCVFFKFRDITIIKQYWWIINSNLRHNFLWNIDGNEDNAIIIDNSCNSLFAICHF